MLCQAYLLHQVLSTPPHRNNRLLTTPIITDWIESYLTVGNEVMYNFEQDATPDSEGEGSLCRIISVIGEGERRRYEIIDADPFSPNLHSPSLVSSKSLVLIPSHLDADHLPTLAAGWHVLAL